MIDVHSHLLPGVDDGSPSVDVSVPVLERFAADGVECVVLTPHLVASRVATAPYERHTAILETLRAAATRSPELRLGWEIMLDEPNADLRAPHLGLGGSRAVLVEFPRTSVPNGAAAELFRIRSSGSVPVLAHPERYWGCTAEKVATWRAAGAVIQMDTAGLIGAGSIATISRTLLEAGLVDLFASDNHGDGRSLATARDWLLEVATPEHAELLTRTNARRLLDGESLVPVAPLPRQPGIFARLRELFVRR
ncbi:MAG TPA: CpsB/CapC family capsule biosynthesis tyrosine phosphatase [Gemmatimonadaceae bacterium]|nr:CpsB/CapC family capsule biosynthesis tyrosine phosphatase [Gemmatimonadaceae bacterium]